MMGEEERKNDEVIVGILIGLFGTDWYSLG